MNNTNVPSANTATGLRRLIDFRPGEGRLIAWAFLYLFAVFSSYYVIRPIREVPTGTANFSPGRVNGEVIGGADMSFVSGAQVHVPVPPITPPPPPPPPIPEPASIVLLGTALLGFGIRAKKRIG